MKLLDAVTKIQNLGLLRRTTNDLNFATYYAELSLGVLFICCLLYTSDAADDWLVV